MPARSNAHTFFLATVIAKQWRGVEAGVWAFLSSFYPCIDIPWVKTGSSTGPTLSQSSRAVLWTQTKSPPPSPPPSCRQLQQKIPGVPALAGLRCLPWLSVQYLPAPSLLLGLCQSTFPN